MLERLLEVVGTYAGHRGHPYDQALTLRDLAEGGLIGLAGIANLSRMGGVSVSSTAPASDTTAPDMLTGLTALGALGGVFLDWTGTNQRVYSHTEVWRADSNNLAVAVCVGTTIASLYFDSLGSGLTKYYWVRAVSKAGIAGNWNAVSGVSGASYSDPAYVLSVLAGSITETQLYTDLNTRINLVDAGTGVAGSVNARILTETNNRTSADNAISSTVSTLSTTVGGHTTSISTNTSSISGIEGKYSVKVDNNGHVSGFGLISTANNGAVVSTFIILADTFAIVKPGGTPGAPVIPFVVGMVNNVSTIGIKGELVVDGSISGYSIAANAITAGKISVSTLSAINANLGTITAGNMTIDASGFIRGGATDYLTGTGFYLGYSGGAYKFSIGAAAGPYLAWDGSTLRISGEIVDTTAANYTTGTTALATAATERTSPGTDNTVWTLVKAFRLKKPGSVTVEVEAKRTTSGIVDTWTHYPKWRVKQNGQVLATSDDITNTAYAVTSETAVVVSPFLGDVQIEYQDGRGTWDFGAEVVYISCLVKNVHIKANPYDEKVTLD